MLLHQQTSKLVFFQLLAQEEAVRVCIHMAMEAEPQLKVKTIELIDGETHPERGILSTAVAKILGDLPLIQVRSIPKITSPPFNQFSYTNVSLFFRKADVSILAPANHPLVQELPSNITVEDKKLPNEQSSLAVIGTNVSGRPEVSPNLI